MIHHPISHLTTSNISFTGHVTRDQFIQEIKNPTGQLCRNMDDLESHANAIITSSSGGKCEACGQKAWTKCGKCGKYVHFFPIRGPAKGKNCFFHVHNPSMFGLCLSNTDLIGINRRDFEVFTNHRRNENRIMIQQNEREWTEANVNAGTNVIPEDAKEKEDGEEIIEIEENQSNDDTGNDTPSVLNDDTVIGSNNTSMEQLVNSSTTNENEETNNNNKINENGESRYDKDLLSLWC